MGRTLSYLKGFVLLAVVALMVPLYAFVLFPGVYKGAGVGAAMDAARAATHEPEAIISPADTVTIVLTAATVVLAAVALIVGLIAVVGFVALRDLAREAAEKKAAEVATEAATRVANERADAFERARAQTEVEQKEMLTGEGADVMARALAGKGGP